MTPQPVQVQARHIGWLVLASMMVSAPHAERMPLWVTLVSLTLVGCRLCITFRGQSLPAKWLLLAAAAGATAGIYFTYGRLLGRDSGVTLLVIMLALKLLEMATLRDAMIVVFICYFLVITDFLYSQSMPTALYLLAVVWIITATMIGFQFRMRQPGYSYQLRHAGMMLLQATPLMLAMFLFFPRVPGPLWSMPQDVNSALSGLSDSMAPGSVSQLLGSDQIAFRVSFDGDIPRPAQLYWRGPIMWDFDGYTWRVSRIMRPLRHNYQAISEPISYVVTVEPHNNRWLFALDLPGSVPARAQLTDDFQLVQQTPVSNRLRYNMNSYLEYRDNAQLGSYDRQRALALPENSNPRTRELATQMRAVVADNRAYIRAVLNMFRTQDFHYTITPPPLGTDSVDEFLFSTRAGFCEHYASSFAVMMRAAGVPARIITGYQGGEVNTVGNYLTVHQADAHAWVEVWLAGDGWIRVDPTAAVSPTRVEVGVAAAVPDSEALPMLLRGDHPWLTQASMVWDSFANTWNQAVLGYTQDSQRQLLRRVGISDADWRSLVAVLFIATTLITSILAALMLIKLRRIRPDRAVAAYNRFCDRLARSGVKRRASEGPEEFRRRAIAAHRELAEPINTISHLYIRLRYSRAARAADMDALERAVSTFRPAHH